MGGGCRGGHAIWGSGIGDGRGGRAIWGSGLVPPETAGTERILLALPDSGAHWCWRVAPDALLNNDRRRLHAGQHGHAVTQYRLQLRAGIHRAVQTQVEWEAGLSCVLTNGLRRFSFFS